MLGHFGIELMVCIHIKLLGKPKEELYDALLEVAAFSR